VGKALRGLLVREYREGDEEAILRLYRQAYGRECPPQQWRWKYREGPIGPQGVLALDGSGSLIAYLGGVPVPAKVGDRVLPVSQAVDLMIDASARRGLRQGRLLWVLSEAIMRIYGSEARAAFIFGIPLPAAQGLLAAVPGTEDLGAIGGLLKDLSPGSSERGGGGSRLPPCGSPTRRLTPSGIGSPASSP